MFRVICEVKPRWVLAENVPGLRSSESGRFFGRVLRDLASVGYDIEWESLPAAAFGAPHIRERVFIVAHAEGSDARQSDKWKNECERAPSEGIWTGLQHQLGRCCANMADAKGERSLGGTQGPQRTRWGWLDGISSSEWWEAEPDVGRVADGIPSRVDRLRSLGNAVVPQVAEWIGKRIVQANEL